MSVFGYSLDSPEVITTDSTPTVLGRSYTEAQNSAIGLYPICALSATGVRASWYVRVNTQRDAGDASVTDFEILSENRDVGAESWNIEFVADGYDMTLEVTGAEDTIIYWGAFGTFFGVVIYS